MKVSIYLAKQDRFVIEEAVAWKAKETNEIRYFGSEALEYERKYPDQGILLDPFQDGKVNDSFLAQETLIALSRKANGGMVQHSFWGPKNAGMIVRREDLTERQREKYCDVLFGTFLPRGISFFDEKGIDTSCEKIEDFVRTVAKKDRCYVFLTLWSEEELPQDEKKDE